MDPTQLLLEGGSILTRSVMPALVIGLAVWSMLVATKRSPVSDARITPQARAIESVRQRLARGEIEASEYNRIMRRVSITG